MMLETDEKYFECPVCGWVISFKFNDDKGKYISMCPYCKNSLEIDKEEYEDDTNDVIEKYFEFE